MAEEIPLTNWEIEEIPDLDPLGQEYVLYRCIYETFIKEKALDRISPSAFKDEKNLGVSTDWSKYSTPKEAQLRERRHSPEKYGVVSLKILEIRESEILKELSIEHSPLQKTGSNKGNRAHTDIMGIQKYGRSHKRNKAQVYLARIAQWEINNKLN